MTAKVPRRLLRGSVPVAPHELPATSPRQAVERAPELAPEGAIECGVQFMADLGRHAGCSAIEKIGEIYKLTAGEMRVLHAVVEVGGIRDIAVALVISPTTVKTHLHHIFQKTGTKGQNDLIRLVVRAASSSER